MASASTSKRIPRSRQTSRPRNGPASNFMEQFVPFMQQIVPRPQGNPAGASMAKEITLFVMRGFRVARPREETVTKFFDTLAKMPPDRESG